MKKMVIIKNGSCRRCGQCCDKSKAQPMYWVLMKETDNPDVRIINSTKGPKECPRVCDSLAKDTLHTATGEDPTFNCHIYETRPPICRDFPRHPKDLMEIDNCGYYFTIEWRDVDE